MLKCCICGSVILDTKTGAHNPNPLKDEKGRPLENGEDKYCCTHCDNIYVSTYRICAGFKQFDQCELIQKKVLELRKARRKQK